MDRAILHINASARYDGSVTRQLTARIVEKLGGEVVARDLNDSLPHVDAAWVAANMTPAEDRSADQRAVLALSDSLIAEVQAADVLVIGAPLYNFSVPAALKAWIDQIARAGVTFKYTPEGPVGLLEGKRAIIAIASGGVPIGSEMDFASAYLRHIMGFIGIKDVEIIAADRIMADAEAAISAANAKIDALAA